MSPRGGKRVGAGRPLGQGKYGSGPTKQLRIPLSRMQEVESLLTQELSIPLYSSKVQAGFPSPADDYIERYLDLNTHFIKHPAATFFLRATGDSMVDAGIFSGDLLLVDKSLEPTHGKIVIAAINGELTVKRLSKQHNKVQLLPANPKYKPIDITEDLEMVIWGVVILVLHEPL